MSNQGKFEAYCEPNKFAPKANTSISNNYMSVRGYQDFKVSNEFIEVDASASYLLSKKNSIEFILSSSWLEGKTVVDLGANSGFFAFKALQKGAKKAWAVEMDQQYCSILEEIRDYAGEQNLEIFNGNVINFTQKADLVIAFALIHWIYSCTADTGSLDNAVKLLADLCNEVLIVEWIDSSDEAIKSFGHLSYNKEIIEAAYNFDNFQKAIESNFDAYQIIDTDRSTRKIFVAYKNAESAEMIRKSPLNMNLFDIFTALNENGINYSIIRNEDLILGNEDRFSDMSVEVLVEHSSYNAVASMLETLSTKRIFRENYEIFNLEYGNISGMPIYLKIKLIKSNSLYLPTEYANYLLSNSIRQKAIFCLTEQDRFDYAVFTAVYHYAAMENGIRNFLEEENLHTFSNYNNIAELYKYLLNNNIVLEQFNQAVLEFAPLYKFNPSEVIHSRVLEISNAGIFISRLYKNGKSLIKQANLNLAQNEYKALNALNSSNYFPIVNDFEIDGNFASFKLDYFDGFDLDNSKMLSALSFSDVKHIVKELINILIVLDKNGIKHRDISSNNIIISHKKPRLIDFGWAEIDGIAFYTPIGLGGDYKTPTGQIRDIYAMGKVIAKISDVHPYFSRLCEAMMSGQETNLENLKRLADESTINQELSQYDWNYNIDKAISLIEIENFVEAYDILCEVLDNIPGKEIANSGLMFALALSAFRLGKNKEALEHITNEMIVNPENEDAFKLHDMILESSPSADMSYSAIKSSENAESIDTSYDVSIIIPVMNNVEFTKACLASIYENVDDKYSFEIIVVDNGSVDATFELLKEYSYKYSNFKYLRNDYNLGFAKASNQGISQRKGQYALLLNNDTVVTSGWLTAMLDTADLYPNAGAIGACLVYPGLNKIQHIGVVIGTEDGQTLAPYHNYRLFDVDEIILATTTRKVSAVTGACMLISPKAIEKVGLLDENYINGLEDIDYCFAISGAGMDIMYCSGAYVYHHESMTLSRHDHDIQNWQRLNQKWLGKVVFDEPKMQTILHLDQIKSIEEQIKNNSTSNFESIATPAEYFSIYDRQKESSVVLSIIILAHNQVELTKKCIESIVKSAPLVEKEIIVVDNASSDSTPAYLQSVAGLVKIITNKENLSFSTANNKAAAHASGKYLLFLNNDTELFPGSLDNLLEKFEENEKIGVQGGKLLYPDGSIQHAGIVYGYIAKETKAHYHIYLTDNSDLENVNKTREFQFVTGALLAIRSTVFTSVGGFDTSYHFGHEDLDLCLATRKAGYKVIYNPEVVATHYESMTKKLVGIEKFERFTGQNNFDDANQRIFNNKWADVLISDADNYYLEDGIWGLCSDTRYFSQFEQKALLLIEHLKEKIEKNDANTITQISYLLFSSPDLAWLKNPRKLFKLPISKIEDAIKHIIVIGNEKNEVNNSLPPNLQKVHSGKNILMTMHGWDDWGGGTTLPRSIAIELARRGNQVTVLYAAGKHKENTTPYYLEKTIVEGVTVYGLFNRSVEFLDPFNPKREICDVNACSAFSSLLDIVKPDIVHYHNFLGLSMAIADICHDNGIESFFTPYNYYFIDPSLYMFNPGPIKWDTLSASDNSIHAQGNLELQEGYKLRDEKARDVLSNKIGTTMAVSERQAELLRQFSGADNIVVINQIPDIRYTRIIRRKAILPLNLAFIGGVMPHKGLHLLAGAAAQLGKNNIHVDVFGATVNEYKNAIESNLQGLDIKFHGAYTPDMLPVLLSSTDIVCLPSIWEDCAPLVIAEALALGIPVIGPNIGGFSDFIIDGYNGYIYDHKNPQDIYNILNRLINNPILIDELTANCQLNYQFKDYIDQLEMAYQGKLKGKQLEKKFWSVDPRNSTNKIETNAIAANQADAMNRVELNTKLQGGFSNSQAKGLLPNPLPSPLKLNLGCGNDIKTDWLNIDLFSDDESVVLMDIRKLELPDNSADAILASDVLEHFSHRQTGLLLKEWARVLKPGAEIIIRCPSLKLQVEAYMRGDWDADIASYMIFGGQTNPGDYHCIAFDEKSINQHLENAGLKVTHYEEQNYPQNRGFINLNMLVRAVKPKNDDNNLQKQTIHTKSTDIFNFSREKSLKSEESNTFSESQNKLTKNKEINILWEGSQFVYHSLALINREICNNLILSKKANVTLFPYEPDEFSAVGNDKYERLLAEDVRFKDKSNVVIEGLPNIVIRHQWPPKDEKTVNAKWILMQPWELSHLPISLMPPFENCDEIWTPSHYSRQAIINSGIDPDKVQVMPNGVDCKLFTPDGEVYPLKTIKKFKLLFLGGTIYRKGIDILLNAYSKTFTADDDICLVIKDMGGESFYKGQDAVEYINTLKEKENAPEIEYINDKLSEQEIASLYRACDVFVSPYRGEGFSLPTLEAMASGLYVIVTDGGATDDFVSDELVGLIPSNTLQLGKVYADLELTDHATMLQPSENELSKMMHEVYSNPSLIRQIGYKASTHARTNFSWERSSLKIMSRIDALYNTTLSREFANSIVELNDAPNLISQALEALESKNLDNAKLLFSKAIKAAQSTKVKDFAIKHLALTELSLNNPVKAQSLVSSINTTNDPDVVYINTLAEIERNRLVDALEYITPLLNDWNTNKFMSVLGLELPHLLCITGDILQNMGDYTSAEKVFESVLQISEDNPNALKGIILCNVAIGNKEKANIFLEKAKRAGIDKELINNLSILIDELQ